VQHPIIACAADVSAALKAAHCVEPVFMSTAEKQEALIALTMARSQLDGLTARLLAASDDVGQVHGLRDAAAWLAVATRTTRREARGVLALGRALEQHPGVATALRSGGLRAEQARVVAQAVDALPARVDAETRDLAETTLLELATRHDAGELKQVGKRILDVVAPEVGECHEAGVLAAEEARAAAEVDLVLVDDGEGQCHGRFRLPSHVGKMFKRRRLGEALIEYVERYPADRTPQTAGVNATVVVTMTLEQLLTEQATALLDDGGRISAGQARRLACEAGIIPAVLDTKSQPLDLGRTARLFTSAQRIALGLRDGGCTARGCETTASGCHAHHDDPWSRGGATDLAKRPAAVPPPPPPGPQLPLRDDHPRRQHRHLHPADVRVGGRCSIAQSRAPPLIYLWRCREP
jgi:hypothetical protein